MCGEFGEHVIKWQPNRRFTTLMYTQTRNTTYVRVRTHKHRPAAYTFIRIECDKIIDCVFATFKCHAHTQIVEPYPRTKYNNIRILSVSVRVWVCVCVFLCVSWCSVWYLCIITSPQFNIVKTTSNIVQMRLYYKLTWTIKREHSERARESGRGRESESKRDSFVCECVCAFVYER